MKLIVRADDLGFTEAINNVHCKLGKFPKVSSDNLYDPFDYILNDEGERLESDLAMIITNPGYVDQELLEMS